MASVRARVTLAAAVLTLLVLSITGALLVQAQIRTLRDTLDERLEADAAAIAARVADGVDDTDLGPLGDDDTVAQVVRQDGAVIAATANARDLASLTGGYPAGDLAPHGIGHLPTDEARYRLVARLTPEDDETVAVLVAATTDDVDESANALRSSLLVTIPVVTALLAALTWWMVGRTLRPVESIRAEVEEIRGGQMHRRVPVPPSGDEVARLATTMNDMLDRVAGATRRQERFVADASHELRSPLTRIRAELEVDAHHPGTADLERTHRSVLEETIALQALVEDLLHLARSDAGATPTAHDPVDLADVIRDAVGRRAPGVVEVDLDVAEPVIVPGDRAALVRAVANLVDNAVRHASTAVRVSLHAVDGFAQIDVADDGSGVPAADQQRVFERFAQLDDARHDGGTGLGLAIVAEVAARHGGTVAVDPDHHPGARFTLTLPT